MKIKYLKLKNWLLVSLAGLLGINISCDTAEEYGCPEASYRVKGTVVNEEGEPIAGIGVGRGYLSASIVHDEDWRFFDTTDADGKFDVLTGYQDIDNLVPIDFHDTDGESNDLYSDTTVQVSFKGVPLAGGHGWYEGEATREISVTLQRAEK